MAELTPFLQLYKPGGGSTGLTTPDEVVDIDRLNVNSDKIDADAKTRSDKVAVLEDKTKVMGLQLIIPAQSQLVNATVAADGTVTLNAATSGAYVEIRDIFTAAHSSYIIQLVVKGPAGGGGMLRAQFMRGAVKDTGPYSSSRINATVAGVLDVFYSSSDEAALSSLSGTRTQGELSVFQPSSTDWQTQAEFRGTSSALLVQSSVVGPDGVAHTGIAIRREVNGTTGTLKIYGYA